MAIQEKRVAVKFETSSLITVQALSTKTMNKFLRGANDHLAIYKKKVYSN